MTSAKARYEQLAPHRLPYLNRARECSKVTIPSLIPPEGHTGSTKLPEPYQGLGSRLVVHLASRLMTALMPPGRSFLRLGVAPEALLKEGQSSPGEEIEQQLALVERLISTETERRSWRQPTNVSLQHLIVGGNAMEQILPDNSIKVYPLDRFVVVRNSSGEMVEFVICEGQDPNSLSMELQDSYAGLSNSTRPHLYTWGKFDKGQWRVHQELEEVVVSNSVGAYGAERLPFFALRWGAIAGEAYGRSKVEEHLADFMSLEGLSKAMLDGAAMAARNITLIRPGASAGVNLRRKLAAAGNGETIVANPDDIQMLSFTNSGGLQIVQVEIAALRQELAIAFLLNQAATRDAERVTATEIRSNAIELEGVLGGAYSMLSQDMMLQRVRRLIFQMQSNQQLPAWPEKMIEPLILTGLEALGREAQVQSVVAAGQLLAGLPPEETKVYVKWDVLLKKGFNGLNLSDAVRTEGEASEVRKEQMQMQAAADAMSRAAAPVAQAVAGAAAAPTQ